MEKRKIGFELNEEKLLNKIENQELVTYLKSKFFKLIFESKRNLIFSIFDQKNIQTN